MAVLLRETLFSGAAALKTIMHTGFGNNTKATEAFNAANPDYPVTVVDMVKDFAGILLGVYACITELEPGILNMI